MQVFDHNAQVRIVIIIGKPALETPAVHFGFDLRLSGSPDALQRFLTNNRLEIIVNKHQPQKRNGCFGEKPVVEH